MYFPSSSHRPHNQILVLGLVLSLGCGSSGGGGGDQPSPTPTPSPQPTVVPTPSGPAGAGVTAEILSATFGAGQSGSLQVEFVLTDEKGEPITPVLSRTDSDQEARVRLTAARLEEYAGGGDLANTFLRYVNQIDATRPGYDRDGTLETLDVDRGLYRYTFAQSFGTIDSQATYSVGMQVDREFAGVEESANPVFDFVPGGGTPQIYGATTTAQCNQCHAPLVLHGNRREVRLCMLCHTEAGVDEKGNSIAFRNMIHKIHAGVELPSIVDGPPGSFYGIYSGFRDAYVVFAEKNEDGEVEGVEFPRPLEDCAVCHTEGPTVDFYRTKPAAQACATCHDDVNPSQQTTAAGPPGTNHPPGGFADGQCSACHRAEMVQEFDVSVPGAHVVPERSSMLPGLHVDILDVLDHMAGQTPTVVFRVSDDADEPLRDLSGLNRLAFAMAGPTSDYEGVMTATAVGNGASGTLVGPDADGVYNYTTPAAIPDGAFGSWSLGAEARRPIQLTEDISVNEATPNPVVSFSVDGSETELRRTVVDDTNCFRCHGEFSKGFSIHGNLRNRVDYCVLCHNPNGTDAGRRRNDPEAVAAGSPVAPIHFKVLIHKIHRGHELAQQPYVVYGFGQTPPGFTKHDFGEVHFSGDLSKCDTCHVEGSQWIPPFPGPALPTVRGHLDPETADVIVDGFTPPITAACTSCHDDGLAMDHAAAETSPNGNETCEICHSEGGPFAASELHAEAESD